MRKGFSIHKQAVLLEYNLNRFVNHMQGTTDSAMADITMVYEQPVRLMRLILQECGQQNTSRELEERKRWMIQMIINRYLPYEDVILAQLDEELALSLCQDLEALNQALRS